MWLQAGLFAAFSMTRNTTGRKEAYACMFAPGAGKG